jgi:hypothetical protein
LLVLDKKTGFWEGVGEDTEKSYNACLREISQNDIKKEKNCLRKKNYFNNAC